MGNLGGVGVGTYGSENMGGGGLNDLINNFNRL